jgi:hypothetical protein
MFMFVLGVAATLIVQTLGKALGLWGKRQIVGSDSVSEKQV